MKFLKHFDIEKVISEGYAKYKELLQILEEVQNC